MVTMSLQLVRHTFGECDLDDCTRRSGTWRRSGASSRRRWKSRERGGRVLYPVGASIGVRALTSVCSVVYVRFLCTAAVTAPAAAVAPPPPLRTWRRVTRTYSRASLRFVIRLLLLHIFIPLLLFLLLFFFSSFFFFSSSYMILHIPIAHYVHSLFAYFSFLSVVPIYFNTLMYSPAYEILPIGVITKEGQMHCPS